MDTTWANRRGSLLCHAAKEKQGWCGSVSPFQEVCAHGTSRNVSILPIMPSADPLWRKKDLLLEFGVSGRKMGIGARRGGTF